MLAENLANEPKHFSGGWNFGPAIADCVAVGAFAEGVSDTWGGAAEIRIEADDTVYEERLLALDSTKAETEIGWRPRWALPAAIANTVTWYQTYYADGDMAELTARQIRDITGFQVRNAEFV